MTRIAQALLRDEVLELLAERPDLVAVADAVSATQPRPRRRRRSGIAVAVGLAAALVVAVWHDGSNPGFAERAEAAIGSGPVLDVVVEAPARTGVVDIASGKETPLRVRLQYRYDAERGQLRTTVSRGGRVSADVVQTPAVAGFDPALVGFVSGYRDALTTTQPVEDVVGGRRVLWIEFGTGASRERVAIDPRTLTPLFVESLVGRRLRWRVLEIRARERRATDFQLPSARDPQATSGSVVSSRRVALGGLAHAPWRAVGPRIEGLTLASVEVEELVRGYAGQGKPSEPGVGARLVYRGAAGSVEVQQAPRPEPAYAYLGEATFSGTAIPAPGRVVVTELPDGTSHVRWLGQMRAGPIFVTIWASSRDLVVAAARAFEPIARRGS